MIRLNSRRLVHEGRVLKLFTENVTFPGGVRVDMDVVRHPGAAAIVPFSGPDRVLLLKQYRHAVGDFLWEIPAGTLKAAEPVIDCAQRELIEETGHAAENWRKLGEITPVPGYSDERIHLFAAWRLNPVGQNLDADEVLEVVEMGFEEALAMIPAGEIVDGKTITGLLLAQRLNPMG